MLLALLMMTAIAELELVLMPDQWRLNLATNAFASSCDRKEPAANHSVPSSYFSAFQIS